MRSSRFVGPYLSAHGRVSGASLVDTVCVEASFPDDLPTVKNLWLALIDFSGLAVIVLF
jgi:hypothetical protein